MLLNSTFKLFKQIKNLFSNIILYSFDLSNCMAIIDKNQYTINNIILIINKKSSVKAHSQNMN
ncbi:MAG: hypothetical protein ACI9OE_001404 [Mariniflexile sp.]|jgi:hypothetical protein